MKQFVFFKLSFFLIGFVLLQSCMMEEIDTDPPQEITNLNATPLNKKVKLTWNNPTDLKVVSSILRYGSTTVVLNTDTDSVIVGNLENKREYRFNMYTVDIYENRSTTVSVTATPDTYFTVHEGREFESGTYVKGGTLPITIEIDGSDYDRVMTNQSGATKWMWSGTLNKTNDTTYTFDYEYTDSTILGVNHVADLLVTSSGILCFDFSDTTYYCEAPYTKIEGDIDSITGKYKRYHKTISSDVPSYNDTTYYYAEFTNGGDLIYTDSDGGNETFSWTIDDININKYIFVDLNDRKYFIDRSRLHLLTKE